MKSDGSLWGMGKIIIGHLLQKTGGSLFSSPVEIVQSGVIKASVGSHHLIYLKEEVRSGVRVQTLWVNSVKHRVQVIPIPLKLYQMGRWMWQLVFILR